MANELISLKEMALWTQSDQGDLAQDPFAAEVRTKVSDYLRFLGGHDDWTISNVPTDVKNIAIWMTRRTYVNPDQEVSTNVGPLGSRVLDDAALAMNLTDSERAVLDSYKAKASGSTGIWRASIASSGPARPRVGYVTDDQQVNIGTTNAGPDWMIPWDTGNDVNQ